MRNTIFIRGSTAGALVIVTVKIPSKLEVAPHALGAKCGLDGGDGWIPLRLL